jgi:hypothetical protein
METEANNASQETELDITIVDVNEDINSVTDRQVRPILIQVIML